MYFEDLTPYEYHLKSHKLAAVLNVGWLDAEHNFPQGIAKPGFLQKLSNVLSSGDPFNGRVNAIRGVHRCNLCDEVRFLVPNHPDTPRFVGSCQLWIPNLTGTGYFASPSMIVHYVETHKYLPPPQYVASVLALDLGDEFCGQEVYEEINKQANEWKELQTDER